MTRWHSESLHDSLSCVVQPSADGAALTGRLMEDTTARWMSVMVAVGSVRAAEMAGLGSDEGATGLGEVDCQLEIERKYEVIPAVICSMSCLFGIIYCFFGPPQDHHRAGMMWVVDHSQHCSDTDVVVVV
ncbi:hypothetical protein NFI96_002213 [Prochilodus magdalenae]|nr:hypothetical protein NFI96_002213 [Prochilodus magdalenae]